MSFSFGLKPKRKKGQTIGNVKLTDPIDDRKVIKITGENNKNWKDKRTQI